MPRFNYLLLPILLFINCFASTSGVIAQVLTIGQASDLKSTSWAFQSLQSLTKRYQCVSPNFLSRETSILTRDEFATEIESCIYKLDRLLSSKLKDQVSQQDLDLLQRLQSEFATELKAIDQTVDSIEQRTNQLESQQFSPTTKLTGQAIFAINAGTFGGNRIIAPRGAIVSTNRPNIASLYRVSFDLNTSFNHTDLLKVRLVAASPGTGDNAAGFLEPNFGSVLDFAVPGREQVSLGRLYYTFKPIEDLSVTVGPQIVAPDFVDKNRYANASFRDFSTASITNNFILLPRPGGAGASIDWKPKYSQLSIRGVYIASSGSTNLPENQQFFGGGAPNDIRLFPTGGGNATGGLFGDPYLGVVEVEYAPTKSLTMRLQYGGGELFGSKFGVIGVNAEVAIAPHIGVFARYGSGSYPNTTLGNIRPQYWSAGIAFQDLFTKNDLAGIGVTQPFILSEVGNATQTNFEAFYNIPVSNNLSITPIVQIITNPANQNSNGAIFTGTVRAVFSF
jgi:Carbohydrate-selective porin, OprB family